MVGYEVFPNPICFFYFLVNTIARSFNCVKAFMKAVREQFHREIILLESMDLGVPSRRFILFMFLDWSYVQIVQLLISRLC